MKIQRKKSWVGFLFTVPFLAGFILFYCAPIVVNLVNSFFSGAGSIFFVGLDNYKNVWSGFAFQLAVKNTLKFIAIAVPLIMVLTFFISLLLESRLKKLRFFRSIFLIPLIIPVALTSYIIQSTFSKSWINSPNAFPLLVLLYLWKNFGYNIIIFCSFLSSIPDEYYSVANLEGASAMQKLRYITLPVMKPSILYVLIISIVNVFKSFREAFVLGGNNPHKSIYMLQHFINQNFKNFSAGSLAVVAITVLGFVSLFIVLILLLNKISRGNRYEK